MNGHIKCWDFQITKQSGILNVQWFKPIDAYKSGRSETCANRINGLNRARSLCQLWLIRWADKKLVYSSWDLKMKRRTLPNFVGSWLTNFLHGLSFNLKVVEFIQVIDNKEMTLNLLRRPISPCNTSPFQQISREQWSVFTQFFENWTKTPPFRINKRTVLLDASLFILCHSIDQYIHWPLNNTRMVFAHFNRTN
jgi:hypothetical protein